jgi:hypothetical protein
MKTEKSEVWDFISANFISLSTVVAGVLVLVLQQLGRISTQDVATATLALLALLATTEIIDKSKKLDRIESLVSKGFEATLSAVGEVTILKFTFSEDGFAYMAKRIRSTQHSIDHAAFAPPIPRWSEQCQDYEQAVVDILRETRVRYRYISSLEGRPQRLSRVMKLLSDTSIKRYFPAFYLHPKETFPGFSLMIFDDEEVVVYFPTVLGGPETVLSIRNTDVAVHYIGYFARLWADAKPLDLEHIKQLQLQTQ